MADILMAPQLRNAGRFATWGKQIQMTWQFLNTYMDEAWGLVSADWISTEFGQRAIRDLI